MSVTQETPPAEPKDTPTQLPPNDSPATSELEAEVHRLRRAIAKTEKESREADEARKKEQGRWQELAEENQRKAESAELKLAELDARQRVVEIAKALKFRDPQDAYLQLGGDIPDDEKSLRSRLDGVAKDKKYLLEDAQPPTPGLHKVVHDGKEINPGEEQDDTQPGLERLVAAYGENST